MFVPGCGMGHDARWLADHGCEVVAADVAPLAIEGARALDPERRIDFRLANLFDLPPDLRGAFDFVWEHTCLSALTHELRDDYVRGVKSALKPGGQVALMDFKKVGQYVDDLRACGISDAHASGLIFWIFPPVRIAVGRKTK